MTWNGALKRFTQALMVRLYALLEVVGWPRIKDVDPCDEKRE